MSTLTATATAIVRAEAIACRTNPDRFNETFLGRPRYWARQAEIARSVATFPTTLVPTGNAVGKTFLDAGVILWFLAMHSDCRVIATAPSQTQLEEVLWKEVERAYRGARVPLGGRLLRSPLKIDLGGGWDCLAYSTTTTERFSGHHRERLLFVGDEASGIPGPIFEAADSLNPSRVLLTGNPLRPDGTFYDRCTRATETADDAGRLANVIRIPSLESPDIDLPRSPRGLADAGWLARSRNDYGEGSLWWLSHVLALFPGAADDTVIPGSWLDLAGRTLHVAAGPRRIAIDLATGGGGDRSVILCRDDNGIIDLEHANIWTMAETAKRAAAMALRHGVAHHRITWDVEGIGADFLNRLTAAGLVGCQPYRGGNPGGVKYANLRAATAWMVRQRLDPARTVTVGGIVRPQPPFAIRPDWLALLRPELIGMRYTLDTYGRVVLEKKADFVSRLRHSPDFADALCQSFAFPNA